MTLSGDLSNLAVRVKEAEERSTAAREKAQGDLEAEVESARAEGEQQAVALREAAERGKGRISGWWEGVQKNWSDAITEVRRDLERKKGEHDVQHARRRAENAEKDAEFAIDFAYSTVVEAEYAVLDAALAQKEAEELSGKAGASTSSAA